MDVRVVIGVTINSDSGVDIELNIEVVIAGEIRHNVWMHYSVYHKSCDLLCCGYVTSTAIS